jgi:predicted secreted protein
MLCAGVLLFMAPCAMALAADLKPLLDAAHAEKNQQAIYAAALKYLKTHSTEKDETAWRKSWNKRLTDAEAQEEGEEKYTQRIIRTFAEDNIIVFENPDAAPVEKFISACRLYCVCIERNVALPSRIASRITDEMAQRIVEVLNK